MQRSALWRSRRQLSNVYLLANCFLQTVPVLQKARLQNFTGTSADFFSFLSFFPPSSVYLLAKCGFDTAEKEPRKVLQKLGSSWRTEEHCLRFVLASWKHSVLLYMYSVCRGVCILSETSLTVVPLGSSWRGARACWTRGSRMGPPEGPPSWSLLAWMKWPSPDY